MSECGVAYLMRGADCEKMRVHMKQARVPFLARDRFPDVTALWTFLKQFATDDNRAA